MCFKVENISGIKHQDCSNTKTTNNRNKIYYPTPILPKAKHILSYPATLESVVIHFDQDLKKFENLGTNVKLENETNNTNNANNHNHVIIKNYHNNLKTFMV